MEQRDCAECNKPLPRSQYSKNQWRKGPGGRCSNCVNSGSNNQKVNNDGNHLKQIQQQRKQYSGPPTPLSLDPRPQMDVPGFEGALTVCTDWPQTRKGEPPAAQSAVFMPLLACVIGPVEGHCNAEQLEVAQQWWALALPAWPRWVESLRQAGVAAQREQLIKAAKGHPNPLIHNAKGHGTIPHFKGKMQVDALEKDPMVALEVYACVTCLYSQAALAATPSENDQ
ncbi:expressed unknown protein [Seminavis robusta]|uniref:Uncharacterized protein n=1 Tax=Seminavis robusta TaxID=568900 RepID=A0A9N8DN14_9STRA|nr:expressed unknown protein [Seminavis robusta]|eukprot:Sro168_g074860.1 n/a (226) ;mRNA; r:57678-58355